MNEQPITVTVANIDEIIRTIKAERKTTNPRYFYFPMSQKVYNLIRYVAGMMPWQRWGRQNKWRVKHARK